MLPEFVGARHAVPLLLAEHASRASTLCGDRRRNRLAPRAALAARVHPTKHVVSDLASIVAIKRSRIWRSRIRGKITQFTRIDRRNASHLDPHFAT